MINRRTTILTIVSAVLFAFCLPTLAAAQSNDPWHDHDDDRDYRRDRNRDDRRDRRRDRDDDYYGNGNYDTRNLRNVAERIKDRSRSLERSVDRLLDNSRVDGTRREDHINQDVKEFRKAADRFRSRVGDNGRDRNRGYQEAQNLIQSANHAERMLARLRVDSRTYADWREIKQDLRIVANAYGLSYNGNDDGYYRNGNGGYDPRDNRNRDRRSGRNDDNWWRQLPGIINGRRP
ncbi:MAG: hypothetical protein LC747_07060 [Acidobacteria bacterium]|nr:hypothetical protein [Acidobacteriota bacterium]